MATTFVALPAPAANGSGAAVDVSTFGAEKTIVVEGNGSGSEPFVLIEFSNDNAHLIWSPLVMFLKPGERTVQVACRFLRATVKNYQGGGAPVVNVGGDDNGASFVELIAPAGNGNGAGVDTSALPPFKTIQVSGEFTGTVNIEVSNDAGVTYSLATAFQGGKGGKANITIVAEFMRVRRTGVSLVSPGLPIIDIGAADATGGGSSGGGIDIQNGGVPLAGGPFTTLNLLGTVSAADGGGSVADVTGAGGGGGGDRTWFGNAVDGDLVVLTGTVVVLDAHRAYDNVTIQTNAMLYSAGYDLHVADTFTTEGTGTYEASGGNGANAGAGAGAAVHGNGGNLGTTVTTKSGYTVPGGYTLSARAGGGSNGGDGSIGAGGGDAFAPNNQLRTNSLRQGGHGGASDSEAGGDSLVPGGNPTDCYATPAIATGLDEEFGDPITGGAGGGGGGGVGEGTGKGGAGGGAGGTLKLYARTIVAQDGSIRSTGGNGGAGLQASGGGGGGGQGGVIFIITEGAFDVAAKCDISGGNGGAGSGTGTNGLAGQDGEVVAISTTLGPL